MKYKTYARCGADGEWEEFRVPTIFITEDVADHCCHATLCMWVPKGHRISIKQEFVEGPTWAVWDKKRREFIVHWRDLAEVPLKEVYQYS